MTEKVTVGGQDWDAPEAGLWDDAHGWHDSCQRYVCVDGQEVEMPCKTIRNFVNDSTAAVRRSGISLLRQNYVERTHYVFFLSGTEFSRDMSKLINQILEVRTFTCPRSVVKIECIAFN